MVKIPTSVNLFVNKVKKQLKPVKIILFGSRSKGTARKDSDYDILIVSPTFKNLSSHNRAVEMYRLHTGDFPLEVICLTPREFKEMTKTPSFIQEAMKDSIILAET